MPPIWANQSAANRVGETRLFVDARPHHWRRSRWTVDWREPLRAGHDVGLVGRPRVIDALRTAGLAVESPTGNWHVHTPAVFGSVSAASARGPADLICITTKAYDLAGALDEIAAADMIPAESDTVVAAFQNGVGAEAVAARFGAARTLAGHDDNAGQSGRPWPSSG